MKKGVNGMPSSKQFKDFVLEQLRELPNITCKSMMGEYLLYCDGLLFGGIYDDRFLIKKTNAVKQFELREEIPYENAKPVYLVENLDDIDYINEIIKITCDSLKK